MATCNLINNANFLTVLHADSKINRMPKLATLLFLLWVLFFSYVFSAVAETEAQEEEAQNLRNGILTIRGNFQIFPVGKIGNTLYVNNTRIVSKPKLVLQDAIRLFGGYIYYGIDGEGEPILGFEGNPAESFRAVKGGFYTAKAPSRQRKILRIAPDNRIQILLPSSNTATGIVYNGFDKAAFYHIYKGEVVETKEGETQYQYTFRIHIVRSNEKDIVTLRERVVDYRPNLKLQWVERNRLQYRLSSGDTRTFVVQ